MRFRYIVRRLATLTGLQTLIVRVKYGQILRETTYTTPLTPQP